MKDAIFHAIVDEASKLEFTAQDIDVTNGFSYDHISDICEVISNLSEIVRMIAENLVENERLDLS